MDPLTRRFARGLSRLNNRVQSLERSNQTGYGSLEGGRAIEIRDVDGAVVGSVGSLPDGSVGTVDLVPTEPPTPTTPDVVPGPQLFSVAWVGGYLTDVPDAVTVAYVGVHVTQNPDDPEWVPSVASELTQITPGGGTVVLPGDAGVETGVVLVAVSAAGVWSAPTPMVQTVPQYAVDIDMVGELTETVEVIKTDGLPPASPPTIELVSDFGRILVLVTPPENPDPITGYVVYVNGTRATTDPATSIGITVDADGTRLPYGSDTLIEVSAEDADGEGPLSDPAVSRPRQIVSDDITNGGITEIDIANFAVTVKKFKSPTHMLY